MVGGEQARDDRRGTGAEAGCQRDLAANPKGDSIGRA
jgi:hypothetical protein